MILTIILGGKMMRDLLSTQDKRHLIILEVLYQKSNVSYKELAECSNASINTVVHDIKIINKYITPFHISFQSQEKTLSLKKPSNTSMDFIYSIILKNSLEFRILELIFFEKFSFLEDYADALFISLSTLKRLISKMNKVLQKREVQITTNPIQLVGNEKEIYMMIVMLFREKYIDNCYPFEITNSPTLNTLVHDIAGEETDFSNYQDIERVKLSLLVSLVRLQNHHYLEMDYDKIELNQYQLNLLNSPLYRFYFKSVFHIELSKKNLIELFYPFLPNNFATSFDDLMTLCEQDLDKEAELTSLVSLLEDIASSLAITLPLEKKQKLTMDLFNIRLLDISEDFLLHNTKLEFVTKLKKDAPVVFHFLNSKFAKNLLFSRLNHHGKLNFTYMLVTHWDGLFIKIQSALPVFHAGLLMNSDKEHSGFITRMLNDRFKDEFIFHDIEGSNLEECFKQFSHYAFIVTNQSQVNQTPQPIISIGLYPSAEDLSAINAMYLSLIHNQYTEDDDDLTLNVY